LVKTIAMLTAAVSTAGRHTRKYTHFWYLQINIKNLIKHTQKTRGLERVRCVSRTTPVANGLGSTPTSGTWKPVLSIC
jgi:hypothetical protein